METTIYVKAIYEKTKESKKFNTVYKEYQLYSTQGLYYTSTKSFNKDIKEGSDVLLEADPQANPKYFRIKFIKAFNLKPRASPTASTPNSLDKKAEPGLGRPAMKPALSDMSEKIDIRIRRRFERAKVMAHEQFPEVDYTEYPGLVVEYAHQLFAEESMLAIQRSKETR